VTDRPAACFGNEWEFVNLNVTRAEVIEVIKRLERARSDDETAAALATAKAIVPNARISDLVFYGERDRTHSEIADEALRRESIWLQEGGEALREHIERQLVETLADAALSEKHHHKVSARMLLGDIRRSRP
jgi:hypothetical protein